MIQLSPEECRVLGVLVEKAQTTPSQYPMSLNAVVAGCNQKSNRDPVIELDEEAVMDAIEGLRSRKLASQVMLTGSRVDKFKHNAREGLSVDTRELVVLTELLLRGPQTVGELRSRASRMYNLDSIDVVGNIVSNLMQREPPLVRELAPAPGSRARRYAQLLCPDLHPVHATSHAATHSSPAARATETDPSLAARIEALETRVEDLQRSVDQLTAVLNTMAAPTRAD